MKFPWVECGGGVTRPLLPVGFRKDGRVLGVDTLILVDTGADGTMLPLSLAPVIGFAASELKQATSSAIGGRVATWTAQTTNVRIEIGGHWLPLPTLSFAEESPPLLGRDVIFANFDLLRMTANETELRLRKPGPR